MSKEITKYVKTPETIFIDEDWNVSLEPTKHVVKRPKPYHLADWKEWSRLSSQWWKLQQAKLAEAKTGTIVLQRTEGRIKRLIRWVAGKFGLVVIEKNTADFLAECVKAAMYGEPDQRSWACWELGEGFEREERS